MAQHSIPESPWITVRDAVYSLDVIGLLGNLLSFIVITRYLLNSFATYILFLFLALAGSMVILVVTIETVRHRYQDALMPHSTLACGFHSFFFNFTFEFSAWIIMALTIDRYLTIRSPFAHGERSNVHRGWLIGAAIAAFLTLTNAHYFFTQKLLRQKFASPSKNTK